ncbi:MAG: hypothetical protein ACJAXA_002125 [Candidatus Aldehydirespiratoraceae bacterium]
MVADGLHTWPGTPLERLASYLGPSTSTEGSSPTFERQNPVASRLADPPRSQASVAAIRSR